MHKFRALVAFFMLCGLAQGPAQAADMTTVPPIPMNRPVDTADALTDYARREAVLLLIRQTFSLLDAEGMLNELAVAAERADRNGPTEAMRIALDRALLAEGSYYLVSLRYLVLAGGAAWPADRPARFYEDDAIVRLDALQEQLFEAVATRADPLPVFLEAQRIWALTEGYTSLPEHLDVFGHREDIVESVLTEEVERART